MLTVCQTEAGIGFLSCEDKYNVIKKQKNTKQSKAKQSKNKTNKHTQENNNKQSTNAMERWCVLEGIRKFRVMNAHQQTVVHQIEAFEELA